MTLIPLAAAAMTAAAGAGVIMPFLQSRSGALRRLADPIEDERLRLMRELRDLDQAHAEGSLDDDEYARIRARIEGQAITVLRALADQQRGHELAASLKVKKSRALGMKPSRPRGPFQLLPGLLVSAAVVAATVPLLFGALASRAAGGLITGDSPAAAASQSPSVLAFFEQRVQAHPTDIAARLDLAQQDLTGGDIQAATDQYLQVVKQDPTNVEANSELGLLLYEARLPDEALAAVTRALQAQPRYPEALYLKGVILLALHRPADAGASLQAYLQAAPFGSHRSEVELLLRSSTGSAP